MSLPILIIVIVIATTFLVNLLPTVLQNFTDFGMENQTTTIYMNGSPSCPMTGDTNADCIWTVQDTKTGIGGIIVRTIFALVIVGGLSFIMMRAFGFKTSGK